MSPICVLTALQRNGENLLGKISNNLAILHSIDSSIRSAQSWFGGSKMSKKDINGIVTRQLQASADACYMLISVSALRSHTKAIRKFEANNAVRRQHNQKSNRRTLLLNYVLDKTWALLLRNCSSLAFILCSN